MKLVKENKKYFAVCFILLLLVPILMELFCSNIGILVNNEKRENTNIDFSDVVIKNYSQQEGKLISTNKKSSFTINLKKKYIEKFQYNYHSDENVEFKITIEGYNTNNKKIKKVKTYRHSKHTDIVSKKIGFKVSKITVTTEKENIEISNIIINNKPIFNKNRYFLFLTFFISLLMIISYKKFNKISLSKLYIAVALLCGIGIIIVSPNLATISWDEAIHYNNTNKLFRGKYAEIKDSDMLITDIGIDFPSTYEENKNLNQAINKINYEISANLVGTNVIAYNNYVYIPSAIFRRIGEVIGLSPTVLLQLGKLIGLLVFVLIIGYSIKIAKIGKVTLFVLGIIPVILFQTVSYTRDNMIIAGITLSMVALINLLVSKDEKADFKFVCTFVLPLLIACLAKANYFPLFLLGLLIPKDRFKSKKQTHIFKILMIIITLLVLSTFGLGMLTNGSNMTDSRGSGHVNVAEQMKVVINHPINTVNISIKNIMSKLSTILGNSEGGLGYLAYLGGSTYHSSFIIIIILLFTLLINNEQKEYINKKDKIIILIFVMGILFGISLALYLLFTDVGSNSIAGVQSRYYLPLLYPILACFTTSKIKCNLNYKKASFWIIIICTILTYSTIFELYVWNHYW